MFQNIARFTRTRNRLIIKFTPKRVNLTVRRLWYGCYNTGNSHLMQGLGSMQGYTAEQILRFLPLLVNRPPCCTSNVPSAASLILYLRHGYGLRMWG
ncbi:hypothetical protein Barb4_04221 [Bacteroidales bacterium Barb4]|nr:hypothetical protein Barb4_04221 [Bacteroidales bacterium Barb4]